MRTDPQDGSDAGPGPDSTSDAGMTQAKGAAYQGAVEAIFAALIGTGAGYWVDSRYDTSPFGIGIGALLGFAAMVLRLLRLRELIESDTGDGRGGPGEGGSGKGS